MPAPTPPVPLKDQCSIIHDNVLYVYSPNAFQILPLEKGAQWKQERNGISVVGAECVYGGVDGDNSKSALYVVGGAANETNSDYPGLQRYSIGDKSWTTITPVVPVTQHRQYHGAAYMNASSGLVVYGGSQNGWMGPSSETFFMEMYPPYRVQAYSSNAPPATNPFMLPWSEDRALMVGGSATNIKVYTFGPADGWQDLGLALPNPLPDPSVAQAALLTLDDGSKVLQTFRLGEDPPLITNIVLLNPGGQPAAYSETAGGPTTTATTPSTTPTPKIKRSTSLNTYPTYDSANMPNSTRTDFSIAQSENGIVAFVGGDADSTVSFFNQSGNSWLLPEKLLGDQRPLTSSTPRPTVASTTKANPTASATHSSAPVSHGNGSKHDLTILGAVLGGICGLAAILLVLLLWLRNKRRRKQKEERLSQKSHLGRKEKGSGEFAIEEGVQPIARHGQPMGRSPVPSMAIGQAGTTPMFAQRPSEKNLIRRISNDGKKESPEVQRTNAHSFAQGLFQRERSPLSISRPMNPDLGDYYNNNRNRPSIDLGRATPTAPVNSSALVAASGAAAAASTIPTRNKSQRKTDEAWAKYFNGGDVISAEAYKSTHSRGSSRGGGGFWPGSGAPEITRSPKLPLRDSAGNLLQAGTVPMSSPSLSNGPQEPRTRALSNARGMPARISGPSTVSSEDGDYEDQVLDAAFSSGIPSDVPDKAWTPVGNTWSGPAQRRLRPSMEAVGANDFPPPTTGTSSSGNTSDTKSSGIPSFPMPSSTFRPVRLSGGREPPTISNVQHPATTHSFRNHNTSACTTSVQLP